MRTSIFIICAASWAALPGPLMGATYAVDAVEIPYGSQPAIVAAAGTLQVEGPGANHTIVWSTEVDGELRTVHLNGNPRGLALSVDGPEGPRFELLASGLGVQMYLHREDGSSSSTSLGRATAPTDRRATEPMPNDLGAVLEGLAPHADSLIASNRAEDLGLAILGLERVLRSVELDGPPGFPVKATDISREIREWLELALTWICEGEVTRDQCVDTRTGRIHEVECNACQGQANCFGYTYTAWDIFDPDVPGFHPRITVCEYCYCGNPGVPF
jgi:hypothetical protein